MISCQLVGRTGNQMFQIAATYAHAKRNGFNYCIPPVSTNETLWPSHKFPNVHYARMKGNQFNEPHFHFSEIPAEDNLILNGYFQSAKYFQDYSREILDLFGFPCEIIPDTCAVHVRRQDYITYNKQFNLLPASWYLSAMEEMGKKEYHIFSDDIEWCKRKFKGDFIWHRGLPLQDLYEGAKCENHIMSASSFSWWQAYAGMNNKQNVIVPATWFGPLNQHHDTKDIYLPHWQKL